MQNYQIITDSSCDLPARLTKQLEIQTVRLSVQFRGKEYLDYPEDDPRNRLDHHKFYEALRRGEATSTTAVNPEQWRKVIEPVLQSGQDVLVLAFSSGLSRTCESAEVAARELREAYPQRQLLVIDTLCASLGQGLLVYLAGQQRLSGRSLKETAEYVRQTIPHLCHWFTVDDLMYLKRGGRIAASTALLGTMLQIKPILHTSDEGKLVTVSKARGRKAAMNALVDQVGKLGVNVSEQTMFICHGDCLSDANYVAQAIREKYHPQDVIVDYVGPVIGSHSGPGTLSVFFLGTHR